MSELREFFEERQDEVEKFFTFLEQIESDETYSNNILILKSQAILMLYNLIEGTVNSGIEYIFDTIGDERLKHNEISNEIRVMWLRYLKLHLDNDGQSVKTLENIDKFINNRVEIDIKEFREINGSYFSSGTLDSGAIKKILKKFAIECNFFEYKLKEIKKDRNFLAHGEKSFSEVSRDKQVSTLVTLKDTTSNFLNEYINVIEEYVREERYKI